MSNLINLTESIWICMAAYITGLRLQIFEVAAIVGKIYLYTLRNGARMVDPVILAYIRTTTA